MSRLVLDPAAPAVLNVVDVARLLRIGKRQCYDLVRAGEIPSLRLGRRVVVPVAQLEQLLGGTFETRAPGSGRAQGARVDADETG